MRIQSVFPIPLGFDRIETNYQQLLAVTHFGHGSSTVQQTFGDLNTQPEWENLARDILSRAKEYSQRVGWGTDIELSQMWCNRMHPLATIHPHSHSNSLFSCVFYIFPTHGGTKFQRGDSAWNHLQPSTFDDSTGFLYDYYTHRPTKGDLVFFPSHLKHWSLPVNEVRYTVSANFRATHYGNPLHLNLG